MPSKKIHFLIALALLFNSCGVFKKSGNNPNNLQVVNLDTIETSSATDEPQEYRASVTRINDIIHTKLDVSFNWEKQYMYGKATLTVKPYFYPTSTLVLDARGMEMKEVALEYTEFVKTGTDSKKDPSGNYEAIVSQITVKKTLEFKYENDIITIQLDKEYKNNEQYTVFMEYISKPNELKKKGGSAAITDDKGLYFINPDGKEKDKPKEIWTQGETQSSSVWFPTIDAPNERFTQEIYITVDKKYVTLSNGELMFSTDNNDSTRTDYWKMDLPHAPYLAMMTVGDFAIVKDKWRDKEVNYYVEKEYEPYAKVIFGNTPEMIEFFSKKLGVDYPWNKYSQIVVRDYVSGAMENTTATIHSEYVQQTDRELIDKNYEDYISHELFHQWFGDLVTCESWSNLPLNESFATYAEYLWREYKYGMDDADEHSAESRSGYFEEAANKKVNLVRFNYDDKEDMFDRHSYNKGGQVLHMLRKYIGDDAFFASLKLYLETNKFNSVEIHDLRLAFEKVSGEDLNWFFGQWFLSSGHPELVINTVYDGVSKKQKIEIKQVQDLSKTPLFKLPLAIDIYVNGKPQRHKITVTKAKETFDIDVATIPDLVNVDAEKMLLCSKHENKSINQLVFQYYNAPLYLDRYEALEGLYKEAKDSLATKTIIDVLNDKNWSLRMDAISLLTDIQSGNEKQVKEKLIEMAHKDEKSIVRAAAIDFLSANYKDEDLQTIYKNALNEKSYSVLSSALSAIAKVNPKEGLSLAKQYENEKNNDVLYTIAAIYSNYGADENNDFFLRTADKYIGFSKISFITQYEAFLKIVKKDETVNQGVELFQNIIKDPATNKWVYYYAKKAINDMVIMYDDRVNYYSQKLKLLTNGNSNAAGTKELESQLENAKAQKQKILDIYNSIK
ncbi:MAG: hypothetical protein A3F72_02015 [Bacteroidetes bacterium RIFCSPLOWO2_12_FULL_35_15]|nr:MAG: hypothetical protein A3F72_02015 [Bacteroidetes bacterium RIFCSPLOWO2_12_FULL_35_15]